MAAVTAPQGERMSIFKFGGPGVSVGRSIHFQDMLVSPGPGLKTNRFGRRPGHDPPPTGAGSV